MPPTNRLMVMLFTVHLSACADASERAADAVAAHGFEAVYTTDLWRNARGGLRTGGVHLNNLDLMLAIDGARAWGLPGVSAFAYLLYNNDASFSDTYVGDAMTASNIDAPEALRLYEAWLEWQSASRHPLSVRLGLYDMNSEFDMSDSRSLFINSTHGVGHELGQTGLNGPSIFPVTSLGLRLAWSPAANWRVLAAVFDGVPGDPAHPSSNRIRLDSEDGMLGIVELQWAAGRITKLSLGHWRYTADFEEICSTPSSSFAARDDNRGTYAAIELALDASAASDPATLAFVRYGVANDRINEFADSWGIGIRRRGMFAARPADEIGLAYGRTGVGDGRRAASALTGGPLDPYEAVIELTYRAPITEWLTLQPDIQYIFNPGGNPALDDSLAIGLRLEFSAAARW